MQKNKQAMCAMGLLLLCLFAVAAIAAEPEQPRVGQAPPDSLGSDRQGNALTVSQYRGKVLIVTFWASWCGPCRKELPILDRLQKVVGRDHLEVVAINLKEPRQDFLSVLRANRDLEVTWVHDARGKAGDRYGVSVLPNMFVIDREGRVAHVHRGYSEEMLAGFSQEILALLPPEVLARPAGN
ncbi:TlpA disulfide reductase family protein [Marilutibacter aestuarii]|uniref:TlpA family protein disulfide reductase n=1 Tax=Marilutibacter aestuarii TaxID=1706195 RepID=A0A508ABM0_9GAMM|nr:TlpA disulfide reductase family protein [Lysobacter aestuarii]TQD44425.1 TlpA family protein disulfide reductase [Lysobacter aestuarii]